MTKRPSVSDELFSRVETPKSKPTAAKPTASYRISPEVRDALRDLAQRERVSPAELAEIAIARFLADVEAGRFEIRKDPDGYTVRRE